MPSPAAVLFDFSGTLFRVEDTASWLGAVLSDAGIAVPPHEFAEHVARLERAGALGGGPPPQEVPESLRTAWEERDLSPEQHHVAYTGLTRHAGTPWPELADALYERSCRPEAWHPYPDTLEVLRRLRASRTPVALVSNIGWDPRPVLRQYGADELMDACVLSYEQEHAKPDPELFRIACRHLGVQPDEVLMVGDSRAADGGATAVGARVRFVDPLLPADRPSALLGAVSDAVAGTGPAVSSASGPTLD